jgi:hypothetical protein
MDLVSSESSSGSRSWESEQDSSQDASRDIERALSFRRGFDSALFRDIDLERAPREVRRALRKAESALEPGPGDVVRYAEIFRDATDDRVRAYAVYCVFYNPEDERADVHVRGVSPAGTAIYESHVTG